MPILKFIFLISILAIFNSYLFTQSWVQQNSGTNLHLNCIYFINSNTGFIGADSGRALKTTNGGINWIIINTGLSRAIYSIQFPDQTTGFAGVENKVIKTTNSGLNWDTTNSIGGKYISFLNANTGYSLNGNNVLKTINSGASWIQSGSIPTTNTSWSIFFTSETNGIVGGTWWAMSINFYNLQIWKTTSSGQNWNTVYAGPISTYSKIYDVHCTDNNNCFALGNVGNVYYFYKSVNGGINWNQQQTSNDIYYDQWFIDNNTGWLVGNNGKIIYTDNGAVNWFSQNSGINSNLNAVFFVNSSIGYTCGANGVILKTTNGGITAVHQTGNEIPEKYSLSQNYPNPFNPATQISFDIPKTSIVNLTFYDAIGRVIAQLVNQQLAPGSYKVEWDASNYPSGVYYYRLQAGEFVRTNKMVLLK